MYFLKRGFSVALLLTAVLICMAQVSKPKKHVINGYVAGYRNTPIDITKIDGRKLTHINYAFVNCADSMAVLLNPKVDTINFRLLNSLKKDNPDLQILISIGGWTRSKGFSDAVLTESSRRLFAKTSTDIIRNNKLDGIDIDWEYPGQRGDNNKFRPEDKRNFTLMFIELRKELDKLGAETGKRYLLTAALGASQAFLDNTEMAEVGKILDYLYLMTYDFNAPNGKAGHHTNLYSYNPNGPSPSADQSIRNFIEAGVPASKLGIGVAFYGKAIDVSTAQNNGLLQPRQQIPLGTTAPSAGQAGGFTRLKETAIDKNGYKRYWDKKAQAPYLFNTEKKVFITYDDEKSVKLKSQYVRKQKLAGIFFWEYFADPSGTLLDVLNDELND